MEASMFFGFLIEEKKDRFQMAQEDPTSLGNILIGLKYITPEQLEQAIAIQKSQKMLGEVLVDEMGAITPDQLEDALLEQKLRRKNTNRGEILELHARKRRRLITRVNQGAEELNKTSERVAMKMGEGLVCLGTKIIKAR